MKYKCGEEVADNIKVGDKLLLLMQIVWKNVN
jgi:hypothetical protein